MIGKGNRVVMRFPCEVRRFSALFGNWHTPCIVLFEPAQVVPGSQNRMKIMKSMFAQAATFAFSAAGAMAILVGSINQPLFAANVAGAPAIGLVSAASTPAVSPTA